MRVKKIQLKLTQTLVRHLQKKRMKKSPLMKSHLMVRILMLIMNWTNKVWIGMTWKKRLCQMIRKEVGDQRMTISLNVIMDEIRKIILNVILNIILVNIILAKDPPPNKRGGAARTFPKDND